jgi:hypothetical protein
MDTPNAVRKSVPTTEEASKADSPPNALVRRLKDNGLSLAMLGFFLLFALGQALAGWLDWNEELKTHGEAALTLGQYLLSGHFYEALFENWESEFLQMGAFVALTACLYQRGSAESRDPDGEDPRDADPREEMGNPEAPGPVRRGGWQLKLYENSLSLALGVLFLFSFIGHAISGAQLYSQEQMSHGEKAVSVIHYLGTAHFWFESMQNWQSEFLAVFSLAVLSIYLRQKGSPESKPVAAPHSQTGAE